VLSDSSVIIGIMLCLHDFSNVSYHDSAFRRADSAGRCSGIKSASGAPYFRTKFSREKIDPVKNTRLCQCILLSFVRYTVYSYPRVKFLQSSNQIERNRKFSLA
jgi:hypothetical protein